MRLCRKIADNWQLFAGMNIALGGSLIGKNKMFFIQFINIFRKIIFKKSTISSNYAILEREIC